MAHEEESPARTHYLPDLSSYRIVDEIRRGVSDIVYNALCIPINCFNEDGFELDPVFPMNREGDESVKQVRFGGESSIGGGGGGGEGEIGGGGGVDREAMLGSLVLLRESLEEQWQSVMSLIAVLSGGEGEESARGELSREEQLIQVAENLQVELEREKKKNLEMELELEFLRSLLLTRQVYSD